MFSETRVPRICYVLLCPQIYTDGNIATDANDFKSNSNEDMVHRKVQSNKKNTFCNCCNVNIL